MHATVRSVIEMASERQQDVCILDTEASPEHLSRGTAQYADAMLLVVEPYFKSLETGRRMAALAKDLGLEEVALIANKMRGEDDLEAVREFAKSNELEIGGVIPFDERMQGAERAGKSPFDFDPDAPAVAAIEAVARKFVEGAGSNGASGNGAGSHGATHA
jgi:CO dehydrogenase maturation factor